MTQTAVTPPVLCVSESIRVQGRFTTRGSAPVSTLKTNIYRSPTPLRRLLDGTCKLGIWHLPPSLSVIEASASCPHFRFVDSSSLGNTFFTDEEARYRVISPRMCSVALFEVDLTLTPASLVEHQAEQTL